MNQILTEHARTGCLTIFEKPSQCFYYITLPYTPSYFINSTLFLIKIIDEIQGLKVRLNAILNLVTSLASSDSEERFMSHPNYSGCISFFYLHW